MAVLFSIQSAKLNYKPSVHAIESATGRAGVYDTESGRVLVPDCDAIREALPHYWRKAFDRAGKAFWFPKDSRIGSDRFSGDAAHCTLRDSRGVYLATIYALPYRFNA